jgi:hypothetical protein
MKVRGTRWLVMLMILAAVAPPVGYVRAAVREPNSAGSGETAGVNLGAIRERARSMPIDARIDMDKRIGATVERVNRRAAEQGQTAMAARLAAEFKVTREALLGEKGKHGWSWGETMIAYTLLANSPEGLSLTDLATLREDGLGWASIAYGLQFRLEDFEEAIKAQGRVVMGMNNTDGKAEVIRK